MEKVAWGPIIVAGWPVLSILFLASIAMVAIILERWRAFGKINLDHEAFLGSVGKNAGDPDKIIAWCEKSDQPLAQIARSVFKAPSTREDKERHLQRAIQLAVQQFDKGISVLGTTASVAPFVGLLGTVIGIIRAFHAVSSSSAGSAASVALGISEALVGTAAGLIVAIPALLAYNYFVHQLRRLTREWEVAGGELVDLSLKRS
ncbi:MAG: MotA/TolQ/ExbB proton channel family protein [Elusimicrobia bacterium]|nr:MotA/TolQ/ExbB proton channel family protein [Elusimicrobiota bacterium]